jgi:hypothetical protein
MSETPDFMVTPKGGAPDTARPRFYVKAVQNNFKSERDGKPVFEDQRYVEVHIPGDRKTVVDRPVKPEDRERWPREYAAFEAGLETPLEGLPLEEWAGITRSQVEELRFAHVRTVEQLAALPDDALNRSVSMGGFKLREAAIRHLAQAAEAAPMERLAAESAEKDAKMALMQDQMNALQEQVAKLLGDKEKTA